MVAPVDIGENYDQSLVGHDDVLQRARKIAKPPVPYEISNRFFVSLVAFCYHHFAVACSLRTTQNAAVRHAVTSILVPKRSKWVCRESLSSIVNPGHLLSPDLLLIYRHAVEYMHFIQNTSSAQRHEFLLLRERNKATKWGPFHKLNNAFKALGFLVEDPLVFLCFSDWKSCLFGRYTFRTIETSHQGFL